jgi:DNA polymerase-1
MAETLYIIDAYAQIFRAYFAIRGGMHSPVTSEPTHAVFGVAGMLFKLFNTFDPHYVIVAVDAPGKTFRDELYTDYKATRSATPDDLIQQIPRVFELFEAFGIPQVAVPGLEADDVIATVTHRLLADPKSDDIEIRIVSKDKDLEQLLGPRVSLFDIHTDTLITPEVLWENKGITPKQVVEVLALTGDTVDNVPGVKGIGPKTAAKLVHEFGSVEGILANLDKLKEKDREKIAAAEADLRLSRTLVELKCDADFEFSMEEARVSPLNLQKLLDLFQQLGFNRYQDEARRLAGRQRAAEAAKVSGGPSQPTLLEMDEEAQPAQAADPSRYTCIATTQQLADLLPVLRSQPLLCVDTETTGLGHTAQLCGIALSWQPEQGVYIPVRSSDMQRHLHEEEVLTALRPILEDPGIAKTGHNLKFDAAVLLRCGLRLRGIRFDTMLASALLNPSETAGKLDSLALHHLNYRMIPISDLIGTGDRQGSIGELPMERTTVYAAEDTDIALRLHHLFAQQLEEQGMLQLMHDVEGPLTAVLAEMEHNGILCDPVVLRRQGVELAARVEELKRRVFAAAGTEFDINSTKQLADVLFDQLGLPVIKKTKTGRSTDVEVLERLAANEDIHNPKTTVPRLIMEYRQLAKLISTYLGNLEAAIRPETGRIHTTFHQMVTATGRLASNSPNLQNIPVRSDVGRQIRQAFVAPEGWRLICADYSQIELRLLAHLSEDPALLEAFANDADIHTAVAAKVFGVAPQDVTRDQRNHAKTINFGIIYGVTPWGLARRVEGLDVDSAARLIADYKKTYAGIDRFLNQCVHQALEHGYVTTLLGRRRAIPEVHSRIPAQRALGERLAINTVVQGSAADLIKVAMVHMQQEIDRSGIPMRMLLQIHDELVFETPQPLAEEHAAIVCRVMENAIPLKVPLRAEAGIGANWMEAK